ncbi:SseB family protein [Longimicrobium sp.]|uniref:SseB family protein n=1 Tax=Longimicrobium sp. TaxID=2029185 RepID=UPI002E3087F3|nr:SseB family protein [Longimicrobium sp.]HEX6037036.1 SseB family protein [Longimicrobium sp.]
MMEMPARRVLFLQGSIAASSMHGARSRRPAPAAVHINQRELLTNHSEDGGRGQASEAIRAARAGQLDTEQMLGSLLAAQVSIPLAETTVMDGARLLSWKPATVTRDADGEQFVIAFTDGELDQKYAKWRPEYPYRLRVGADWLITVLPAGHGVIINLGGDDIMFEWPARDILAHRADHET